jgi:AcrR family transcriptional regulator
MMVMEETRKYRTIYTILKAAESVFVEKGFGAASTLEIAKRAEVNKSLIFHHFKSKEALWKAVKEILIREHMGKNMEDVEFPNTSFQDFIIAFCAFRIELYENNPSFVKMMSWEKLAESSSDIQGIGLNDTFNLMALIKDFQMRGEVRADYDPEMIVTFLFTSTSMPFIDRPAFFDKDEKQKHLYLRMVMESLYQTFSADLS